PFRTDAELKADVRQAVIDGFKNGTALKLSTTPPELTGRQPLFTGMPGDNGTAISAFVANGQIYAQVGSQTPSPAAGFYRVGPVPVPKDATGSTAVREALAYGVTGLDYVSETDAGFAVLMKEGVGSA